MANLLEIKRLKVATEEKIILDDFSLTVKDGEIHAIMGPNGAGKSTLAKVIAGHPAYEVLEGTIEFYGEDLLELEPEERALKGVFMSFQYPLEISGISNEQFLFHASNSKRKANNETELDEESFRNELIPLLEEMDIPVEFLKRDLNSGFSGGEKKRNEILQMAVLNPLIAVLDETDSGLDIDALRTVANGVNRLLNDKNKGLILITHYQRLLDYIKPHFVHVMKEGRIVKSGGAELALELEEQGYAMQCKEEV